jgi:type IV pilus assembly protein PilC
MANFYYKAIDGAKNISEGYLSAAIREDVASILSRKGLSPVLVREEKDKIIIKGSVPAIEKITFCRYMSIMMSTGLSLSEGIDVLKKETKNPLMAKVLGDMSYSLEQGQQLSIIFERYPDVFEPYFLTLIKAGEVSGKLADVFRYLEAELRAEYSLNSKVKGALLYPGIVFSAMIGIGILMFFFVLPQIGKVFLNLKMPLPAFTKTMFTFSITLSNYMVQIILTIFVLGVLLVLSLRNRVVRDALFSLVRPVPVIRNLLVKIDLARFSRIFSTLIKSAVPITEALEIALSTLSLAQLRAQAKVFPDEIKRGKSLSLVIKESKLFPSLLIQMVTAGEKTAMLDTTLADLATFYEEEVEEEVKSLTQIIEPVLMLGVGVAVGVMILSIIAPIYSVVGNFQQAAGAR